MKRRIERWKIRHSKINEWVVFYKEEIVKEAFSIDFNFSDTVPIVLLEGQTDEDYFEYAKRIFNIGDDVVQFKFIGHKDGNKTINGGCRALDSTSRFYQSNPDLIKAPIILLYDCEEKPCEGVFGKYAVMKNDLIENGASLEGVENLINFPENFNFDEFEKISQKKSTVFTNKIRSLDKTKLCTFLLEEYEGDKNEVFKDFKAQIDKVLRTIEELKINF